MPSRKKLSPLALVALLFFACTIVYGLLSSYPRQLAVYSDELRYLDVARSLLAGQPVRAANAYLFRYWLGGRFYFVSTNYTLDPVCILHLPGAAKDRQLAVLYRRYAKKGSFPPLEKVHRLCCLPAAHPPLLRTLWVRLLARL